VRFDDVPPEILGLVRADRLQFSWKIMCALEAGEFDEEDMRICVLRGWLHKRQKDEQGGSVDGYKYAIHGHDQGDYPFYVCGKIKGDEDGRLFFLITAHERD